MARQKTQINPEHYYTIYNWMLTDLGLSSSELLVYAFIFAYSTNANGKGCYFGGSEAMSLAVGYGTKTVQTSINKLCEARLIEKKTVTLKSGAVRNYLRVNEEALIPLSSLPIMEEPLETLRSFDLMWEDLTSINKNIAKIKFFRGRMF